MKLILPGQSNSPRNYHCLQFGRIAVFFISLLILTIINTGASAQTRVVTFNSSGTWQAPCGVTSAAVYVWAAGGGGAGANDTYPVGGGGGGGAFLWHNALPVTPGTNYTITIGAGGAGGVNGNGNNGNAFAGGNSSFGTLMVAGGGQGGKRNPSGSFGERGYVITQPVGAWGTVGGNGADGAAAYGGGGGSSASPLFNGAVTDRVQPVELLLQEILILVATVEMVKPLMATAQMVQQQVVEVEGQNVLQETMQVAPVVRAGSL